MNAKTTGAAGYQSQAPPIKRNQAVNTGGKDKDFTGQFQICYESFYSPKTMAMVEHETGIMRPNICRYVGTLKKDGKIRLIKTDTCPITKCKAGFYQTDRAINPGSYVSAPVAAPLRHSIQTPKQPAPNPKAKKPDFSYSLFNDCTEYE